MHYGQKVPDTPEPERKKTVGYKFDCRTNWPCPGEKGTCLVVASGVSHTKMLSQKKTKQRKRRKEKKRYVQ